MPDQPPVWNPISRLPPRDEESGSYNAIVETPRGSRHKYKYEEATGLFSLSGVLPAGAVFPYDFGFLPGTKGEDGDPLDVLLLLDDTAFAGCRIPARLLGAIEAEQTEEGETVRNDRLIAVSTESHNHRHVRTLDQLGESLLGEIEHFFISYNEIKGKKFSPIGRAGPDRAEALIREALTDPGT
ncbi:MAG TPA: inorganic diphosphatase [Longimicrobiaceae bacterium]|nr:inorganic diphosphatase [Longimicrobiaceae bacterium]